MLGIMLKEKKQFILSSTRIFWPSLKPTVALAGVFFTFDPETCG